MRSTALPAIPPPAAISTPVKPVTLVTPVTGVLRRRQALLLGTLRLPLLPALLLLLPLLA
jgi:hypothetical protein